MKIAIVTCYDQNDYIRARGLRTAFAVAKGVETVVVKNRHKGFLRYAEVPIRLVLLKLRWRPDVYVVAFRGYEMLLLMRLAFVRKPIVFDEMINLVEYLREHGKLREGTAADARMRKFYKWMTGNCRVILADTPAHAEYSANVTGLSLDGFLTVPVAADEKLFYPKAEKTNPGQFTVFYYGNGMTPLHGLEHVLSAAVLLKERKNVRFNIVGGKQKAANACAAAVAKGANIVHEKWVPFEELPKRARQAGLCLGGPFGKTLQSQFVVTGKTTQFLACAAPVLVGANKTNYMFANKDNCLLVPPASPKAIAEAISWAADHPAVLHKIGLSGRKLYESHFSQKIVNQKINELITLVK